MSSSTPNSPTAARRDTRPLPLRPNVLAGGHHPSGFHETVASPTSIVQEDPVITPEPESIHDEPHPLRQDSIHAAHLPLHDHSHGTPPVVKPLSQGTDEPPSKDLHKPIYDTAIQNLVHAQLVALGVVSDDGTPVRAQAPKPMSVLRIRLWIAFCVAFFVLAPVVSILLGVSLHAKDMHYDQLERPEYDGRTVRIDRALYVCPRLTYTSL
jgi:hypothetical protein